MNTRLGIIVATFLSQWPSSALADVIPPEVLSCDRHDAGAPCPLQSGGSTSGNCVPSTCSRLDYSQGVPPVGLTYYACLRCTVGGASGGIGGVTNSSIVHSSDGGQPNAQTGGASSELDASLDHRGGQQNAEAGGASPDTSGGAQVTNGMGGGGDSCSCLIVGTQARHGLGLILLVGISLLPSIRRRSRNPGREK